MMLRGTYTALVTPFRDGAIDEDALKALLEFQVREGIDGIVPCGTTGEASTLSYEEHERVIALTVKWAGDRTPVIAGTGSNSTKETIELTEIAKNLGAAWRSSSRPITTGPRRTACTIISRGSRGGGHPPGPLQHTGKDGRQHAPRPGARLARIPHIAGIKEASGSVQQAADIYRLTGGRFPILSGDDNLFLPMMSVGATGVVSVVSNMLPGRVKALGGIPRGKRPGEGPRPARRADAPLPCPVHRDQPCPGQGSALPHGHDRKEDTAAPLRSDRRRTATFSRDCVERARALATKGIEGYEGASPIGEAVRARRAR